jgi:hypothetical protein
MKKHKGMWRVVRMTAAKRDRQVKKERTFWARQLERIPVTMSPCMVMLLKAAAKKEASLSVELNEVPF